MVLPVLCKEALFTWKKIVCYIKLKIIAFFLVYKVCDVNSIPANLRNSKPWTIFQNSLDFTKFPLTVSNLYYVIFKNIKM